MSTSNHDSCATSSNKMTGSSDDPSNIPTGVVGYVLGDGCEDTDVYRYASGVGVDTDYPRSDSESGDILPGVNPRSVITLNDLPKIRCRYSIPIHISLYAPASGERADWKIPGWTCLYKLPFKYGFRFPLPRLMSELCSYHGISPSQLMPNAWRVLMAIEVLTDRYNITFTVAEVLHVYYLKEHPHDKGRYQLNVRNGSDHLILGVKEAKRWKEDFFFVPFDALGVSVDCGIPHSWSPASECHSFGVELCPYLLWFIDVCLPG